MKPPTYLMHGFVFAFGSAIIIYGSVINMNVFVPPTDIVNPIIFSVGSYIFFVVSAYLPTKNLESAGLMGTLLVLGFFYLWSVFLAILIITLASLIIIGIFYKRIRNSDTHLVLNAVSVAVVGYYIFRFISLTAGEPWAITPVTRQQIDGQSNALSSQATTPDIYYIILDGYGREDMLQTSHGFDNSEFIDALEQRDFTVASHSQTNYPRTLLSLSSSLNMQYLETMSSTMGDSNLWWPVSDTVQHSEIRRILQKRGYQTVFFANDGDYSDIRDGDIYEAPYRFQLNIFNGRFLGLTNLRLLAGIDLLGIADPSYDTHRRIILYNFEKLPEVAALKGPKYVFTHIIAPHPPYVFDRSGNPLDPTYAFTLSDTMTTDIDESRRGYIEQLLFINEEILKTIDGILANSESPPIIIIQGDHGPGILGDYDSLEDICLYERYSIFNAYLLPGVEKDAVPMDISPVNSFRLILNMYFGTNLDLLPNRHYFSNSAHFYRFKDVSDQTQDPLTPSCTR